MNRTLLSTHLSLLVSSELAENSRYALAFGISNTTETIARETADHQARYIGNYEPNASPTNSAEPGPPRSVTLNFWA